MIEENCV